MPLGLAASSSSDLRTAFPDGVATARQLVAAGTQERTVYRRCLEGGPWQRPLPGVIFLFTGRPTRRQLVVAALRLGGPGAVLTGIEACRLLGLRRGPARPQDDPDLVEEVHILVPHDRQVRSVGYVHVERTTNPPESIVRRGLTIAPIPRAVMDAARRLRHRGDLTELLAEAVQRRRCTVGELVREMEAGSRRGTAMPRAVLREVGAGVRSAAELAAKNLWARSGLPDAEWNVAVHRADGSLIGVADCWIDDVAMVWEIESTEWHLDPAAHAYTVERAARFTAAGAMYVATKPRKVLTDPRSVVATLRAVHRQAALRTRPPLWAAAADL
jgi:hypothetical protein